MPVSCLKTIKGYYNALIYHKHSENDSNWVDQLKYAVLTENVLL